MNVAYHKEIISYITHVSFALLLTLSTFDIAPSTTACKLASNANIGFSNVIPLAASLIMGFGIGVATSVASLTASNVVVWRCVGGVEEATKADAEVARPMVRMEESFMVVVILCSGVLGWFYDANAAVAACWRLMKIRMLCESAWHNARVPLRERIQDFEKTISKIMHASTF